MDIADFEQDANFMNGNVRDTVEEEDFSWLFEEHEYDESSNDGSFHKAMFESGTYSYI